MKQSSCLPKLVYRDRHTIRKKRYTSFYQIIHVKSIKPSLTSSAIQRGWSTRHRMLDKFNPTHKPKEKIHNTSLSHLSVSSLSWRPVLYKGSIRHPIREINSPPHARPFLPVTVSRPQQSCHDTRGIQSRIKRSPRQTPELLSACWVPSTLARVC